jgi:DnaK suppressor protein
MSQEQRVAVAATAGLAADQVARLQARLVAERDAITGRLAERRSTLSRAVSREPDDSDWASSSADQSLLARLVDRDSKLLLEIERALRKIAAGTYGTCELTGDPIGFDRLSVRPWARHAVASKEQVERQRVRAAPELLGGRVEEDDPGQEVA